MVESIHGMVLTIREMNHTIPEMVLTIDEMDRTISEMVMTTGEMDHTMLEMVLTMSEMQDILPGMVLTRGEMHHTMPEMVRNDRKRVEIPRQPSAGPGPHRPAGTTLGLSEATAEPGGRRPRQGGRPSFWRNPSGQRYGYTA